MTTRRAALAAISFAALSVGAFGWSMVGHVLYYVVMIVVGMVLTTTRLRALFLK